MKPILNIENLTKIYGNVPSQTKALNGVTFQVMPGEFLGIMGSSGSGKSTLLNCTGMGLYLVKKMADDLNLHLEATSQWGKGFKIVIFFPKLRSNGGK